MAHQLGIKSLFYCVVSAAACAKIPKELNEDQERNEIPPGYPCAKVRLKDEEVAALKPRRGNLLSFLNRITTSMEESDAITFRTSREIEGPF